MTLLERTIAERLIDDLIAAGYSLSVDDGEEIPITDSKDRNAILAAANAADHSTLFSGSHWVLLIWGNGIDMLSDYGVTDAPWASVIERVSDWAAQE